MVPPAGDDGFVPAVQQELHAGGFLTVIAASDPALLALGTPVSHLVDKSLLIASAKAAGLATPPTEVFEPSDSLLAAAPKLEYPIVVKPTLGKPARCYRSSAELASLRGRPGPFVVQPYMEDGLWSIAGVLFQGELVASVHQRFLRTWPPDAGMACAAETIEADLDTEARVVELLDGHEGVFQVDLLGRHVLDVNPRVYASMSLAAAAGVNLVGLYCDFLRGRKPSLVRARPGAVFAHE